LNVTAYLLLEVFRVLHTTQIQKGMRKAIVLV